MILNERQYRTSQKTVRETEAKFEQLRNGPTDLSVEDRRVAAESLEAFVRQIRNEIAEYDALRSGTTPGLAITTLEDLPLALIRARIARQWTQAQLAERLGMREQQVQRYERTRYAGANIQRLQEVATALGVSIAGQALVETAPTEHKAVWRKPLVLMTLACLEARWNRPAEGTLEMQKLLLKVDAALRELMRFHAFEFEPYRLGAYDPFLEDDIERLAMMGLIDKHVDLAATQGDQVLIAELRTVPLDATERARQWLETFEHDDKVAPSATKREVRRIVEAVAAEYGALGVSDLIARTYAEHEELTTRSEIRDQMSRRAASQGW